MEAIAQKKVALRKQISARLAGQSAADVRAKSAAIWERLSVVRDLNASLDAGTTFDRAPFAAAMCQWEQHWSHGHALFAAVPRGDPLVVTRRLVTKWRGAL